jgi:serine protease Do
MRCPFSRQSFKMAFVAAAFLFLSAAATAGRLYAVDLSTAIVEVAKKNIPAVVHIEVTERKEVANPLLPFEKDPFLRRFFGNRRMPKKHHEELRGLASGMLMDAKGHILTSYHVAGGATKLEVQLSSGNRYTARLVGGDPKTDLAVIKIEADEPLPKVTFGDSDKLEVGDWVVAIGHPRGLDQTVTQGIISAKHRRGIVDPTSYQDFLQTDAPINPGNSGGPLLNLKGEVIGVNSAIATESGGSEGIGFAVPSNIAVHIGNELIAHGKVERAWMGVTVQDVTPAKAKSLGMEAPKGALIVSALKGGPADKAGITKDDLIVSYQGKPVSNAGTLQNDVAMTPIGNRAKLTVLRDGKRQDLVVTLGDIKDAEKMLAEEADKRLGGTFRDVTDKEAEKIALDEKAGVVVVSVEPKGPLARAGFEKGDIIIKLNGQTVANASSLAQLIGMLPPGQEVNALAIDLKKGVAGTVKVKVR